MEIKEGHKSLGYLFSQICKHRRNKKNELLAEFGLHAGQDIFLYHLSKDDGQTVSSLAKNMCIEHATIANTITRMEANGFIKKVKDDSDKRVSRIFLKQKGKDAMKQVREVWRALETQTSEELTTQERIQLLRFLQQVLKNFK